MILPHLQPDLNLLSVEITATLRGLHRGASEPQIIVLVRFFRGKSPIDEVIRKTEQS